MTTSPDDRLMYAQNWEDSRLERAALSIGPEEDVIAIAGGGCTVMTLLADGPRRLQAVDRNPAQVQLLLLKLAVARQLTSDSASAFLGGSEATDRLATFDSLDLPAETKLFWRARPEQIRKGVISQGRIERYFAVLRWLLRLVHSRRRIELLFEQPTLEAQQRFFSDTWDTPGWRRIFLLTHKRVLDRALDPSFYRYVEGRNLPEEMRKRAEWALTQLPIGDNYFLSWIFRGRYPAGAENRPPYLQPATAEALRRNADRLETHCADIRDFLRSQPDSSCDKFYLSNVGEWLGEDDVAPFFEQVVRVARNGATVCYRALMVDRPLPPGVARFLEEDPARSASLGRGDRAFVNAAFHVVTVRKDAG
jgi:S-adenosylmethionine-diacylglycerol 3-amino-3-carboxypropyl transferase